MPSVPTTLDELFSFESSLSAMIPEDYGCASVQRNYIRRILDSQENPFACQFAEHLLKSIQLSRGFYWEGHEGWTKPLKILKSRCELGADVEGESVDLLLSLEVWDGEVYTRKLALFVCTDSMPYPSTDFSRLEELAKTDFSRFHGALMIVLGYAHLLDSRFQETPTLTAKDLFKTFEQCYHCCNQLTLFERQPVSRTFEPQIIVKWISALGAESARFDLACQASKLIGESHDYLSIRKFGYRSWEHFVCYVLADLRYKECSVDVPERESSCKIFFDFVSSWKGTGPSLRLFISPIVRRIIPDAPNVGWSLALEVNRLKFRIEFYGEDAGWLAAWSKREARFLKICSELSARNRQISTIVDDDKKWILYSWSEDTSDGDRILAMLSRLLSGLYAAGIISHRDFEFRSTSD